MGSTPWQHHRRVTHAARGNNYTGPSMWFPYRPISVITNTSEQDMYASAPQIQWNVMEKQNNLVVNLATWQVAFLSNDH